MSLERIKKLLALADDAGATPAEAASAAAMAAELAVKYNVDLNEARRTKGVESTNFETRKAHWHVARRDEMGFCSMANQLAQLHGCQFMLSRSPGKSWGWFAGQPHNVELSLGWMKFLWDSCVAANRRHASGMNYGSKELREAAREAFRLSFGTEVARRLRDRRMAMRAEGVSGSTALVVSSWFDAERAQVDLWLREKGYDTGKTIETRTPNVKLVGAAIAGRAAGASVKIQDTVEECG